MNNEGGGQFTFTASNNTIMFYNESNFHINSKAIFTPCDMPTGQPDFVSDSGSSYWYMNGGVVRVSNHWGHVASCFWYLKGQKHPNRGCLTTETLAAFTSFSDMNRTKSFSKIIAKSFNQRSFAKGSDKQVYHTLYTFLCDRLQSSFPINNLSI